MWRKRKTQSEDHKVAHNKAKATQRMDTLVGLKTQINGSINFKGGLHIDGIVRGNILSESGEPSLLIVGKNAKITGDVKVQRAVVNGIIAGKLYVYDHLELGEKAVIQGDLHYNLLEMAVGAEVRGQLIPDIKKEPRSLLEDKSKARQEAQILESVTEEV